MRPFRLLLAAAAVCAAAHAGAQSFPTRVVNLVVPNPPGGVVDTSARLVAEPLARLLGQPVVVENKGGASGNIAYQQVAHGPKDGYSLLISYSAYHVGNPAMFAKLPWAQKDLVPVALLTAATNVIAVHPSVPANNLKEFIAYGKANPGKLNFASQGNGSLAHVGTVHLEQAIGVDMMHVPYKGSGAAIQDVLAGQVQVFVTTPPAVIQTLTDKVRAALATPEAKATAEKAGIEIRYLGPDALGALVARETDYWGKVIKARNIHAD